MQNEELLRSLACRFRRAIEQAHKEGALYDTPWLDRFPYRSCGTTSDLLAEYLYESGFDDIWRVCGSHTVKAAGEAEMPQTHAWLTIGNPECLDSLLIDITGDQFKDDEIYLRYDIPVYVGYMDAFHKLFSFDDSDYHRAGRLSEIQCAIPDYLTNSYELISERLS